MVGAGPGDPDLLTIKACRALQSADVIVYDRLVDKRVLAIAPEWCERIYAGKRKHLHTLTQSRINTVLVDRAKHGLHVVRLKGGDPFVFGRGGEEVEALINARLPWEIIPGVTAGVSAAATSGIPLTHRDYAQAVTFITAHRRDGKLNLDWDLATRPAQTVVFYMATSVAHELASGLLRRGVPAEQQLSVVANVSLDNESVATYSIADFIHRCPVVPAPAVLMLHSTPVLRRCDVDLNSLAIRATGENVLA